MPLFYFSNRQVYRKSGKFEFLKFITNFETISAVDVVDVVAVFAGVFQISVVESQTVAANFELGGTFGTLPVFIARDFVSEEAGFLGANEGLLSRSCIYHIIQKVEENHLINKSVKLLVA